jgi:HK97 family phage portal protein
MYGVSEIIANPSPTGTGLQNLSARDAGGWTSFIGGGKSSAGVRVTPMSAMGYPPLWRAINLISSRVSCLPFDCFQRNGSDRTYDETHPANVMFSGDINENMDAGTFIEVITAMAALYGNGYAVIDRDSRGNPLEMYLLDPQKTYPAFYDGALWYVTRIDHEEIKFPQRDVYHIKGLSHNGIQGINVIDIMKDALGVGMAAQQFGGRFFGQGSNAGGILMIPGHFSEEKIRNTIDAWEKMTQGLQKAHKVALLQDGAKFQQLTITNDQAQFLETRQYEIRATVGNIYGIPPHKLGDDTRTSHNSLESENQSLLDDCLNVWLKRHEREAKRKLLTDRQRKNNTHFFEFNREALIQMSFETKVNGIYRQTEMGLITWNEGRRMMNMPDIGPDGDKRFHPANWMEDGVEPVQKPAPAVQNPAQTGDKEPESKSTESVLRAMIASSVTNALQIEKDRIVRASKRADGFLSSVDAIYQTWTDTFTADLGWQSPETVVAIAKHTEESKRQVMDVAGVATSSTLETHVRDLVACWSDRGEILVDNLLKAAVK